MRTGDARRIRERFVTWVKQRFLVRLHMTAILLSVVAVGTAGNFALYAFGVTELLPRHLAVLAIAYVAFLGFVRLWIAHVRAAAHRRERYDDDFADVLDLASHVDWIGGATRGVSGGGPHVALDSGASFGGGGATGSWGEPSISEPVSPVTSSMASNASSSSTSSSSLDIGGVDLDEGGCLIAVLALLVAPSSDSRFTSSTSRRQCSRRRRSRRSLPHRLRARPATSSTKDGWGASCVRRSSRSSSFPRSSFFSTSSR